VGILKSVGAGLVASDHDNHRASGGGDAWQGDLAIEVFTPQVGPFGDRRINLGRIVDDADAADGVSRAVTALRILSQRVEALQVRNLGRVDLLEQAFIDADLRERVGQV